MKDIPVLATVLLLIIAAWYVNYIAVFTEKPIRRTLSGAMTGRDRLVCLALTVVYALFAFFGLGSRSAPQSYFVAGQKEQITIGLKDDIHVSAIRLWSGLGTGKWQLYVSEDGIVYTSAGEIDQNYAVLFRWIDAEYTPPEDIQVKYLRLVPDSALRAGELVLLDGDGKPVADSCIEYAPDCKALFDEQELYTDYTCYTGSYFDEIYHARTALEHLEGINPYEISHPPLGKIIIGIGISLFGMTPFGWRIAGALFGVLMLPPLYILIKKMFRSSSVAFCGSFIFAFDFMHYTQTRIATVDTYGVFFIILMYLFMYLYLEEPAACKLTGRRRLWLGLCGLSFGLGCACKWICVYAGAGLAVLWLIERIEDFARHRGNTASALKTLGCNVLWCLLFFIAVPCLVYYLSYLPYGRAADAGLFSREYMRIVLGNQKYMFNYHSGIVATHPYSSKWYQWIFDLKPILYYLKYYPDGTRASIAAFVSPLLCWAGIIALGFALIGMVFQKDRNARFILIGYLAQLLPWVFIRRLTFEYHYFPSSVFLVLALSYVFSGFREKEKHWKIFLYAFTGLAAVLFIMFLPVLSGSAVDGAYCDSWLKWLETWPF